MSNARLKPARIDHALLFPGEYANPTRGDQSVLLGCGSAKVITPGTFAIALYFCVRDITGTVTNS
jgi:hypothetical protein